jgi:hypothetical protein
VRYAIAVLFGIGMFLAVTLARPRRVTSRVGDYLSPDRHPASGESPSRIIGWVQGEQMSNRLVATAAGALAGILMAQGDLFVEGPGRSVLPLGLLGGTAGWIVYGMHRSTLKQRRARRLRFEGESVSTAIGGLVETSHGVAADEFRAVLEDHHEGRGLTEALQRASRETATEEAQRLYTLLAHAHDTGGRLAEALADLSTDYRAMLARDLTAEGGKRALATYGPVLALMVPVTLLFLLYPTLAGLRSLAGSP